MSVDEPVLSADGLSRTFRTGRGTVSAVDDVSLSVRRGESLGVVGESGCGKSTLARMLVGLERPDTGTITVDGHDLGAARGRARRALRRRIQMVFQDPYTSLDPRLTVAEIVGEPLTVHRIGTRAERRDRVTELLGLVGLPADVLSRHPHQFSGGQRQRIGIARALALEPSVLVCDEPVSALDMSVQAQVVNLLRDLQRRTGVALVFIAHDLSVVRHVSDRVAVMYLGRLAEEGTTGTLYDAPAHPYTRTLLAAAPVVGRRRTGRVSVVGDPPSPTAPPAGCRFHPRCPLASGPCDSERPDLRLLADRHVACHHAEPVPVAVG
ncbi:MAG TPA: oligopeptide/dipeptide ABC transporter ATP-binding protein [Actinocatenispora sp.]